jgi:peptidoglycan/LPS O-acetylase OafA/YrhL
MGLDALKTNFNGKFALRLLIGMWLLVSSILMLAYGDKIKKGTTSEQTRSGGKALVAFGTTTLVVMGLCGMYGLYWLYTNKKVTMENASMVAVAGLIVIQFVGAVLLVNYGRVLSVNNRVEQTPATGKLMIAYGTISMVLLLVAMGYDVYTLFGAKSISIVTPLPPDRV